MKKMFFPGLLSLFFMCMIAGLVFTPSTFSQGASAVTEENVYSKISEAKTPADYEALAAYFREQAANADKQIKVHEKMKESFTFHYQKVGKGAGEAMVRHCQGLIDTYQKAKQNYEAMAQDYEAMAKGEAAPSNK